MHPQPYRALLVDDDIRSASVISLLLQKCGCDVSVCTDPQTGVSEALAEPLDLVCLDLSMPLLDGFEVYTLIRSHELSRRMASVPVVAITGLTGPGHRAATLATGFVAHLDKPVSLAAMHDMIDTVEALRSHLNRVRYSRDEMKIRERIDEMFPLNPRRAGEHTQGILGLALAMEQECTIALRRVLHEGYQEQQTGVKRLVRRLAEFGSGIGAEHWAALCAAIGHDDLDNVQRFERCVVLARAELDRVLYSLRERVLAAPN